MIAIQKNAADWRVPPNLADYQHTRAQFDWTDVADRYSA